MKKFLLILLMAIPCEAQQVRTILQTPVNFCLKAENPNGCNDPSQQPRTIAQLKADGEALAQTVFGVHNTYGTVSVINTVYNYVTIDMKKGCSAPGASLPALNMTEFYQKLDKALAERGETRNGYTYVYAVSPTTFGGMCSHTDRFGSAFDTPLSDKDKATVLAWRLGLRMSIDYACRESIGSSTFVTFSNFCSPSIQTAGGRDITSLTGQGGGSLLPVDRNQLGFLPASQQVTVTGTHWRGILKYIENPAEGLKRLLHPAMGIEASYHAPNTSRGWDIRGVTLYQMNSSRRLDCTPDDRWFWGSTACEPTVSWIHNGYRFTVLSANLAEAEIDIRPSSEAIPTIPSGPRCSTTSPDPSVNVTSLIDGTCGDWKIDTSRRVWRNPGGFFAGYADSITFCNGIVYVPDGTSWSRYVNGGVMVSMKVPANPPCSGTPIPPVDPPPIDPPPPTDEIVFTNLLPANQTNFKTTQNGVMVPMSVTVTGPVKKVETLWIFNGTQVRLDVKVGDTYTHSERAGSPGVRTWQKRITSLAGTVVLTPPMTVNIIP